MPKLNDHGLGGGGKALGVPVYPLDAKSVLQKDDTNGTWQQFFGDATATAPENIKEQASCTIGDEMYFIGTNTNVSHCYKYNVKTMIWTRLADSITSNTKAWAVTIGFNIYYGAGNMIYRYDTRTDTHTESTAFNPFDLTGSRACTDGKDIYIFGTLTSGYRARAYRVNLSDGFTKTQLTNIPVDMYNHGCVYGDDGYSYLFGGVMARTSAYRYHIASNVYEKLTDIPADCYNGMIVRIDSYIYLINSHGNNSQMYVYEINNGIYVTLESTANGRTYGQAGVVDDVIYMIGGTGTTSYYVTGESMLALKVITSSIPIQKLLKGLKCYTDGDVMVIKLTNALGQLFLDDGGTTLDKTNGAVTIPTDGDYALVGSNYATIGG